MKQVSVPNDILTNTQDINLIHYKSKTELIKSKVAFSQYVFSFLIEGQKQIHNTDGILSINNNEFTLITNPVCLMTEKKGLDSNSYESCLLTFNDKILHDFQQKYAITPLPSEKLCKNVLKFSYDNYTQNFRRSLEILPHQQLSQEILTIKFQEIMLYLLHREPQILDSFLSQRHTNIETHFRYSVENNIYSNLSLDELAFLCNMSTSTFKRYFAKFYRTSPHKWMTNQRMNNAFQLLQQGKRPSEIFTDLGYKTLSSFTRAYKKHFGQLPSEQLPSRSISNK
ncbi:AraC family transcriptional regulator [Aureispira sp. CCB-E]|uniref:helix-turn-helix domain-containing protein n=1 Tax=Aureispira sp. CCB-E TaxID=3051121 RepID=UPI00286948BA|nr:AraC family transcriptional regulator [Aureispira sp. CCB-E]WMX13320.1 AraC family transcriptional regulator [Aureispira sp. CCB-E]